MLDGESAGETNEAGKGGEGMGALDRFYMGWSERPKTVMCEQRPGKARERAVWLSGGRVSEIGLQASSHQ